MKTRISVTQFLQGKSTFRWFPFFCLALLLLACTEEQKPVIAECFDFYVLFEEKPELESDRVYSKEFEIGRVISRTLNEENLVAVKVRVPEEHREMIRDNGVFYISDGRLTYDTLSGTGTPLEEGGKLLGFSSKTALLWFKTKNKVRSMSREAMEKAEELYDAVIPDDDEKPPALPPEPPGDRNVIRHPDNRASLPASPQADTCA